MLEKILKTLSNELDKITLDKAKEFMELELSSGSFLSELDTFTSKLVDKENTERDIKIITLILLGLGRNRTIEILSEYEITRTIFEKVRDGVGAKESPIRKANELKITEFKWEAKTRAKRLATLSKVNWEEIRSKYLEGASPVALGKEYKVSSFIITEQIKDEGIFDEMRSTFTKNKIAKENEDLIDDEYIKELIENNPLDSKELLWRKAQEKYPWLLRAQMYEKMESLGFVRTEEEINEIKRIKSKTENNDAYMVKMNGYNAVKEVYGSVENLVSLYMGNTAGSFNKIADHINNNISFDYEISTRQVSKIITNHPNYVRETSLGQKQLYSFVRDSMNGLDVIEEYAWNGSSKKIDVYVPELKVGFEFNGEYWHSDAVIKYNYGKTSEEHHRERVEDATKHGIKLMLVWENDWEKNYKEVEKAIQERDWEAPILNKYSNKVKRSDSYYSPEKATSTLRNQVMRFLREKNIKFEKSNNSHLIKILEHNIIINIPNTTTLANEKETLNLQTKYEKEGIELITFLPWRDIHKIKEFLTYRLKMKSVVKVPARKCVISSNQGITKEQREFFDKNHLLGYNNFKNIDKTVFLSHDGQIVIAALFVRKPGKPFAELKRLVSAYGVSVQGGASRLMKEYIRQTPDIQEIITFSDCDLGFGEVYKSIGFTQIERSKQQLTWYNEEEDMKFSNISLVQVGADRLLRNIPNYVEVGVGDNLPSNQDIVKSYGFIPIYDSGYKKWSLKVNN